MSPSLRKALLPLSTFLTLFGGGLLYQSSLSEPTRTLPATYDASAGALLLYSDEFSKTPRVDKFIGISGLYDKEAIAHAPVGAIRQYSADQIDILEVVDEIEQPKTRTPALLIQGHKIILRTAIRTRRALMLQS